MHSFQDKPALAHAFTLALPAAVFIALFTACGSDSAAFTPSADATSAGGEQPAPAGSDQSAAAPPSAAADSGSARDATPTTGAAESSNPTTTEVAPASGSSSGAEPAPAPAPAATSHVPAPQPRASGKPTAAGPQPTASSKPASAPGAAPATAAPSAHAPAPQPTAAGEAKAAAPAAAQSPAATAHVVVELRGLKSDSGKIQAALFRTAAGFPEDPNKAAVRKLAKINGKKVELAFDVSPPGTFVVLVHHDENGDSKMQRGMLGQPAEGWGATRDPAANFGPPSFDDAKLTINAGETKRVVIKMRY